MQALVYYRSILRYLLAAGLNRFWPRHFFSGVAPLKLAAGELDAARPGLAGAAEPPVRHLRLGPEAAQGGGVPAAGALRLVSRRCWATKWWPRWSRPRPAPTGGRGTGWRWSRSCPAKSGASCPPAASAPGGNITCAKTSPRGASPPGPSWVSTRGRGRHGGIPGRPSQPPGAPAGQPAG